MLPFDDFSSHHMLTADAVPSKEVRRARSKQIRAERQAARDLRRLQRKKVKPLEEMSAEELAKLDAEIEECERMELPEEFFSYSSGVIW